MRLALVAGRLDFRNVLAELDSRDLAWWAAFEEVEGPFGDRAVWASAAQIAAVVAEPNRDPKRRAKPFVPADFLPWIERPAQTPKALRAALAHLVKKKPKR